MKNYLLPLLASLMFLPMPTSAISLSELQNDPTRYVVIDEISFGTLYVDTNSIQSIRYTPPYYTISGKIYEVGYNDNIIIETNLIVNYDYDLRFTTQDIVSVVNQNPNLPGYALINKVCTAIENRDSLSAGSASTSFWRLDGSYISDEDASPIERISAGSPIYFAANYFFYKCYNEYFEPQLGNKFF